MVINNLHRKKLDANREINEATFGNPTATAAYNEFQQCIETASTAVESDASQSHTGLFIDIHGQAHSHGMQELGNMIPYTAVPLSPTYCKTKLILKLGYGYD